MTGIVFRGPSRRCSVPLAETELLSRELRRVSIDGRDAASSAARRIDVALSPEGGEVGPLPMREAHALDEVLLGLAARSRSSAPIARLHTMLAREYEDAGAG